MQTYVDVLNGDLERQRERERESGRETASEREREVGRAYGLIRGRLYLTGNP